MKISSISLKYLPVSRSLKIAIIKIILILSMVSISPLRVNTNKPDSSPQASSIKLPKELRLKSNKNWLAKDFKITGQDITTKDLVAGLSKGNWPLYHGDYGAQHHSPLSKINSSTIKDLIPKWAYKISDVNFLRSSPIVYDGIMYVTAANEVHALNALTGQWLWIWRAYDEPNSFMNRGVAIYGNKIFIITTDCRLVALDRKNGDVIWSKQYADPNLGYFSTMAPLIVGDAIIAGISNQNNGNKGFIVSMSANDGSELWRLWALPKSSNLRGAPTWLTGSYDSQSNTIYWAVGRLAEDQEAGKKSYDSSQMHNDSILAIDAKSGALRWRTKLADYLPFPWDSNTPLVLADILITGIKKSVILQANRNGMFYVIDRKNGAILLSKPFIDKINWTNKNTCPSLWGATNWMSPSFSPITNLFYVMVQEGCVNEPNPFYIKAIEPDSGNIKWNYLLRGSNGTMPGIVSTAGNVVFSGEQSGHIIALNTENGKKLWEFSMGRAVFASPITYSVAGRQFVSLVAGSDVFTFGLK